MRKVLDIGNCGYDHGRIKATIERTFAARVEGASTAAEARRRLADGYDLVLVNRVLDGDGADGLALIADVLAASGEDRPAPPVMLITNYPDYQAKAVAAGAEAGFGKSQIGQPAMLDALRPFLADES